MTRREAGGIGVLDPEVPDYLLDPALERPARVYHLEQIGDYLATLLDH